MEITGHAGAAGCIQGTAVVLAGKKLDFTARSVDAAAEIAQLSRHRKTYGDKLTVLIAAEEAAGGEAASILRAYLDIVEDEVFFGGITKVIEGERVCAAYAIEQERAKTEAMFAAIDDEYLQERCNDINNVCRELVGIIQGVDTGDVFAGAEGDNLIVFAEDLTPVDTVQLDNKRLAGMVTERGGITSHTVILAKALGIPAVVGAGKVLELVSTGDTVLVDGEKGWVVANPDEATKTAFEARINEDSVLKKRYAESRCKPAHTKDGLSIRVNINSGDKESIENFVCDHCDGVGLFRTEFLYMNNNTYPGEDDQFEVYREMAEKLNGKELIIRTLDIGGDKQLDYMEMPEEMNPFLGYRAIRLCLDRTEVFKTQLRAILRAAAYGDVKVMFPMIVTLEELLRAKELLAEAAAELAARGEKQRADLPVGIMIETPAAAVLSNVLAQHCDFFSIGSNDLIQYTTATDRMNERVQYLYDWCNLSVLRLVRLVCENAKKHGIQVGICGETASEKALIPLWAAIGVDELSVAPALVGQTKYILGQVDAVYAKTQIDDIFSSGLIEDARGKLNGLLDTQS